MIVSPGLAKPRRKSGNCAGRKHKRLAIRKQCCDVLGAANIETGGRSEQTWLHRIHVDRERRAGAYLGGDTSGWCRRATPLGTCTFTCVELM